MTESSAAPDDAPAHVPEGHVLVIGPDGQAIGAVPAAMVAQMSGDGQSPGDGDGDGTEDGEERSITDLVEQPAKVMRIGSMIRQLLDEVKSAPLDEASRARLKEIHSASIKELESGLAPELIEELERLALPFSEDATPTEGELRIAQAQLVGWLEGLFHGIQTAIYAQQVASRAQLEQMRRALPGMQHALEQAAGQGPQQGGHPHGAPGAPGETGRPETGGMYL